jgi:KipI family sensor histidine kinase inhibitor
MRILPSGTHGLLLELDDLDEVRSWHAALEAARLRGVVDLVPAARTLLVVVEPDVAADPGPATARAQHAGSPETVDALAEVLREMQPGAGRRPTAAGDELEVPVVYDGDDLADIARLLACSPREVVARHTSEAWTVAFCGFAPGFGYLVPDGEPWDVPRQGVPRTTVPAGSVGVAGPYTGVYPRASPGGWRLLGRTPLELFDVRRTPPALLTPGRRVRFVEVAG